jgi:hypothetical protein
MYGLINQGLKDMVSRCSGPDTWRAVCSSLGVSPDDFELLQPYEDSLTQRLIQATAAELGVSESEVLQRFGRHWIIFTAHEGYGPIMDLFGGDFRTCLKNLNRMHAHMGAMMPKLQPPRFDVQVLGTRAVEVRYSSSRLGLVPMVHGLLEGLAEKFSEKVKIELLHGVTGSEQTTFLVEFEAV